MGGIHARHGRPHQRLPPLLRTKDYGNCSRPGALLLGMYGRDSRTAWTTSPAASSIAADQAGRLQRALASQVSDRNDICRKEDSPHGRCMKEEGMGRRARC
ncbi:hypothetical protein SORBI_3009G120301 [Sorghum bicolor]|uniref:Uncharacterized protein n=1 Tax=Sorghum bicolor TaxID=4558 RepID=A0A1Z5R3E6_SORBI|nr:hypothetical protein SORBI_3009G120301 [Sorghum bicolor]OQU77897.1 hypothetical protein SORBI_3009G120301 [Sorghum bicolor]OQU77899.1 hypothetical protein SORBI_3009G120301 [Sorghum bicolor]OQU77903.1 hypothetical protein SORBI_3009G120301 [Sorghum bicolor]OQU77904.1 hypothetical protein SORBI_3009G120301 [Sorghum bicolor]